MKKLSNYTIPLLFLLLSNSYSQFHDYSYKFGIQGHLLVPSTEFNEDAYRLSLLGRGFLRFELNSFLEAEIGTGIAELKGKDFQNSNWGTLLLPTDLRIVFSPLSGKNTSPYLYSGVELLRWKVSDFPKDNSPEPTKDIGWNMAIPIGVGFEIALTRNTILDVSGSYTFARTDDLNFYNKQTANDGYFSFGFGLTFVSGSGENDIDNDGLTENVEFKIGTNPQKYDTDEDKISDGDEFTKYKTNPLKIDTDSDGLSDYNEIYIYLTDPLSKDTDGDNVSDGEEINNYKSDPNSKDSDQDNITDGYEVNIYKTDPTSNDTDKDKLGDDEELKIYKTDPNNADTDGDGAGDGEEIFKLNTNPLIKDVDKKYLINTDKLLYINNNKSIVLEGVTFENNQAELKPESETILEKTFLELKNDPTLTIEIRGYTDNVGDADYNQKLSQKRAETVRLWLVKKGIDALRIKAVGFGENNPIADNSTVNGRNQNRRIEIIRTNK